MRWLKFLIAVLIVTAGVMVCNNALDNDSWGVLAEGREIVENGIYYEDQLSMHEDLNVTVQNYGFAVIFYLIYSAFGPVGIYISMLILNLVLCYLIYKICMLFSNKNINLSLIIMILTDLLLARWFVVTRAQMVSYIIIMLLIYLLELYVRTDKTKYLWWIPVLSLIEINIHASIWLMLFVVMLVYIIDGLKFKKLHLSGYRKKPLVLAFLASILVGFLNPYGPKMMTLMFSSYGIEEASKYIVELYPFDLGDNFSILLFFVIAITMIIYIFAKKQNIKMRWLLLIFGFLALGINTVKAMSYLILVLLLPMAVVYKDVVFQEKYRKWGIFAMSWAGMMAVAMIVTVAVVSIPQAIDGPNETMIKAVNMVDSEIGNINKKDLKVYTGFDFGGYLEYRGYKPYLDPRMEVFLKDNNGKEDIFIEWYKMDSGDLDKQEFLDKYDFDFLVTVESEKMYNLGDEDYEMIFEEKIDDSDGVRVYKKIKNVI